MKLVWGFSLAFLLGLALFVLIWVLDLDVRLQLLSTIIVLVFGVYVGALHRKEAGAVDAIYYLGFIFTLTALCFSLLPAAMTGMENLSSQRSLASTVLSSFSVAFTTTLAGLLLRVFLHQINNIQEEAVDAEITQRNLARASESIVIELQQITGELSIAKKEISESLKDTGSAIQDSGREYLESYKEHFESLNEAMLASADTYKKTLEQSGSRFENVLENTLGCFSDFNGFLKKLEDDTRITFTLIAENGKETLDSISSHSERASRAMADSSVSNLESIKEVAPTLDSIVLSLGKTVQVIDSYNQSMKSTTKDISANAISTLAASDEISEFADRLSAMTEALSSVSELATSLKNLDQALTEQLGNASEASLALNQLLIGSVEKVSEELERQFVKNSAA